MLFEVVFIETFIDFIAHWYVAAATFRFCFLNIAFSILRSDQLMVHTDSSAVKIQIRNCQSAKLADSHSGSKKNLDFIQISAEVLVVLYELKELLLLFW